MAPLIAYLPYIIAAVSAAGALKAGQSAQAEGEYNAQIAERDAQSATYKAEYDARASALKFKMLMGKQRAAYGKAGVDITSGSPLLQLAFQAEEGERERQAILYSGRVESQSDLNKAKLFRDKGKQARSASYLSAGTSFLGAVAAGYGSAPTAGSSGSRPAGSW